MVGDVRQAAAAPGAPEQRRSADYTGAVYGSLLAASVVAGTSPRIEAPPPAALAALLLATGIVFWLAHAFARLVGDRTRGAAITWSEVRTVARHEWPIVQAAVPPAAAVGFLAVLGASDRAAAWAALLVAVAGQVGWAVYAAVNAGATRRLVIVAGVGNLMLGLLIVLLKATLSH